MDSCNDSVLFLKKALCEAPILAYPLPKGLFVLDTDASSVGIGGVISQVQDKERNIAYGSKKVDKQQEI